MEGDLIKQGGGEELARRAAARLAGEVEPNLPALTERAIAEGGVVGGMRSFEPVSGLALAAFLLSVAQFGWTIYRDLKEDREKSTEKAAEARAKGVGGLGPLLVRRIRLGINLPVGVSSAHRDRIVAVVVEEILNEEERSGGAAGGGWDDEELR